MIPALPPLCSRCEAPFDPYMVEEQTPDGIRLRPGTLCPHCVSQEGLEKFYADKAARAIIKPLASLLPIPGPDVEVLCMKCRQPFMTESVIFREEGGRERSLHPTLCDACGVIPTPPAPLPVTPETRRRRAWVKMVGPRYETLTRAALPKEIQPFVDRVLAWTPGIKGIGLVGPSGTGKSPLLYGLGQELYAAGFEVVPTSGVEFQREYLRGVENREPWQRYLARCEEAEILLIDDADKLNLSPGVEAEYYGMFEYRRNWQLPVLCTLNLSGSELAELGRDRSDRVAAIVQRLRDLAEFIHVKA